MPKNSENETTEHIFGMSLLKRAFGYAEKRKIAKTEGRSGDVEEHDRRFNLLFSGAKDFLRGMLLSDKRLDVASDARRKENRQKLKESEARTDFPLVIDDVDILGDLSILTDKEKERLLFLRKKYENSGRAMGTGLTEWEQLAEKYGKEGVSEELIDSYMSTEDRELLELAELERKISSHHDEVG